MTIETEFGRGVVRDDGYIKIRIAGKYVMEHILRVEKALGRKLPKGAEVHHVNEIRSDNRAENLVLCPTKKYHKIIHQRMNALLKSGDANKRPCKYCKEYDDTVNLVERHNNGSFHKVCRDAYNAMYRERIRVAKLASSSPLFNL